MIEGKREATSITRAMRVQEKFVPERPKLGSKWMGFGCPLISVNWATFAFESHLVSFSTSSAMEQKVAL